MLGGIAALYLCSAVCVATFGLRRLPSGGWMHTASSTFHQESWWVCVNQPSGVEQFSLWTEFDPTLKRLGSQEISGLWLLQPGEQLVLNWLPI